MYILGFDEKHRPPYFHWLSYEPGLAKDNAWACANLIRDYIPDLRNWIYDRLLVHGQKDIRNSERIEEFKQVLDTAREYDRTTLNSNPYHSIVTHLYVCELLAQSLLCFFDKEKPHGHGYKWHDTEHLYAASVKGGNGIAQSLHELFFSEKLVNIAATHRLPDAEEFMRLLPELRSMYPGMEARPPLIFSCEESYGGTAQHPNPDTGTYHSIHINDSLSTNAIREAYPDQDGLPILFPELEKVYTIARYANVPLASLPTCDQLISVTHDVNGAGFALSFGLGTLPKMRDIEIRYYLLFVLGSIARYDVPTWSQISKENPILYYKILRFLEHNQILFPLLILRYLSGRTYAFVGRAVLH